MASPLDDIRALARDLPPPDVQAADDARRRLAAETTSDLLIDVAAWLAAWPGGPGLARRGVRRPILALYASSFEHIDDAPARTRTVLERLAAGGGAVGVLARALGAGVEVFDLGLERPAPDPARRPVMTERECAATAAFGMEALAKTPDVLILSDLTLGSEATAERLAAVLCGEVARRPDHARDLDGDPLQALRRLGGRETAAMVGAILAARVQGVPVLLDGPAARAAATVCDALNPGALGHVRFASGEPGGGMPPPMLRGGLGARGEEGLAALAVAKLAGDLLLHAQA